MAKEHVKPEGQAEIPKMVPKAPLCHNRACALKGISDQSFSRVEAEHFLTHPTVFYLCYPCRMMLERVRTGTGNHDEVQRAAAGEEGGGY